jgi:galactokinase
MAELVPQLDSIEEVYAESPSSLNISPEHKTRWKGLISSFSKTYGHKPDFVARSPGRVNIIGEHIDYSLYDVLPMAVTVDALIAVKRSAKETPTVNIADIHPDRYPSSEFKIPLEGDIEIDPRKHEWTNYFKAGLRGALQFLRSKQSGSFTPASLEVIVDGNVPSGGGLSSSAALVCASALAVMRLTRSRHCLRACRRRLLWWYGSGCICLFRKRIPTLLSILSLLLRRTCACTSV